jgi:hypothetical protein
MFYLKLDSKADNKEENKEKKSVDAWTYSISQVYITVLYVRIEYLINRIKLSIYLHITDKCYTFN